MKRSICLAGFLLSGFMFCSAQVYISKLSKWNTKRPVRAKTSFIVLHTTEGSNTSSLNAVVKQGTCNFLVTTTGNVYTVISTNRVAKHAGRSMWNRKTNLSNTSIGIEVVGYHDRKPTVKQISVLKKLIYSLKKSYRLTDKQVVTHSMIAFDTPNEWHSKSHRGRKRCGMLFATSALRKQLGLGNTFSVDPDVKAGRLTNADPYLFNLLYGKNKVVIKDEPSIEPKEEKKEDVDDDFEGFRTVGPKGVYSIAGEEYDSKSTIYFFTDGRILTGKQLSKSELNSLPIGTKVLVGYVYGGKVDKDRTAYSIVGKDYNLASTFYRFPDGKVLTGDDVDGNKIPKGTIVIFRD
jgi:N-acetyl-anhydromuramyl-L-alanine amidase AmpD